jgi:hypothetical protein
MARLINGKLVFTAAELRDPEDSEIILLAVESGDGCHGEECCGRIDDDEYHWHLRVTGQEPEAGPRWLPIWQ